MLKIGITGGIGSGKSTVCQVFQILGIPVFYADDEARNLMSTDTALIAAIRKLLGDDVYHGQQPDRALIGQRVFNNPEQLARLNALVHPATIRHAEKWLSQQQTTYAIKEAALFFESNSHTGMDIMIGVDAPEAIRITRVMNRNGITREEVLSRIARQMDNDEKMKRCDHVIINDDRQAIIPQVLRLHALLSARAAGR